MSLMKDVLQEAAEVLIELPSGFLESKNGIDKIAFQYWFGEYDELEKFWKQ